MNCGQCAESESALGPYSKANYEVARSPNGFYSVIYQVDGNLVLYKRASASGTLITSNPLWASNAFETSPISTNGVDEAYTSFQDNGNIVCIGGNGSAYWASNVISSGAHPIWIIQDDGNFVGYNAYTLANNRVVIEGTAFGATNTTGGRVSNVFGHINPE